MIYTEIISRRALPESVLRGMGFRHYGVPTHVYVTQYPLSCSTPELLAGKLEKRWTLKRVGRAEGGHLVDEGFVPRSFSFAGFVKLDEGCGGYDAYAAQGEVQLLYEFLRGNTEGVGKSERYPDPRIQIGFNALVWPSVFAPPFAAAAATPFDPNEKPFDPGYKPPTTGQAEKWMDSVFVLEQDSFAYGEPVFGRDVMVEFSFSMRQVPVGAVRT